MQVLLLLLFLVLVSCHYLPFQYYCHLYSSMKTNSLLFVVIQSHLVSWRTKLLVLLELGERDSNGIGPALWLAFMIKCSSCLCCRFFLFLFLSHVFFFLLQEYVFIWGSSLQSLKPAFHHVSLFCFNYVIILHVSFVSSSCVHNIVWNINFSEEAVV